MRNLAPLALLFPLLAHVAVAAPPAQDDFYRIITLPTPEGAVIEGGGLDVLPDGRLGVATRFGDVWLVKGAFENPPQPEYTLFASGLHEALGLAYRDGWIYCTQRGEVTRLKDEDGDDRADIFETVSDGWEIGGDYHEYAFGSRFDAEGRIWVTLCLTGSFSSDHPFRGWAVTVSADGVMTPVSSGIRSPGGVGFNHLGDVFYTDNQGPWNGTCTLRQLKPGFFMGHPASYRWYTDAPNMGPAPKVPQSGSRFHLEWKKIPELMPPAVFFPYNKMGQSASGVECDTSKGEFGPFENQLFVGDQTHSTVMRVFLEQIDGYYQGACFPFIEGLKSGTIGIVQAPDGSLFCSGSSRGWGARGGRPFNLERIVWTGKTPFEVEEMRARPDGFELVFTKPADAASAADAASYSLTTYTYIMQSSYGSPEVDHTKPTITGVAVAGDRRSARLRVDGLQLGHIHELQLRGVRSAENEPVLHPVAYYTLMQLPRE